MRKTPLIALLLLGACVAPETDLSPEPTLLVRYYDLDLGVAPGRAELRRRVNQGIEDLCRYHRDEVTPQITRLINQSCRSGARDTLVRDMPRAVRRAYASALKEAGDPEF